MHGSVVWNLLRRTKLETEFDSPVDYGREGVPLLRGGWLTFSCSVFHVASNHGGNANLYQMQLRSHLTD